MLQDGYAGMTQPRSVGRTAGLNYVSMFACFLPLTGASSSSCKAESQNNHQQGVDGGGGGLMQHLASISLVFFYLQIPHFIANTDAVIYSGVRFQLDHKHNFYDSSLT